MTAILKPNAPRLKSAGAFVTDGKHVLLARRARHVAKEPGAWALPSGRIEEGETPEQAAYRELKEELGHLPDYLSWQKTTEIGTYAVVIFLVPPDVMLAYRPMLGDQPTAEIMETAGWDWVPLDELYVDWPGRMRWAPKLHSGLAKAIRAVKLP